MPATDQSDPPPDPAWVAAKIYESMLHTDPPRPLRYAVARTDEGEPIYLVAVVLGGPNVGKVLDALEQLKGQMVDVENLMV